MARVNGKHANGSAVFLRLFYTLGAQTPEHVLNTLKRPGMLMKPAHCIPHLAHPTISTMMDKVQSWYRGSTGRSPASRANKHGAVPKREEVQSSDWSEMSGNVTDTDEGGLAVSTTSVSAAARRGVGKGEYRLQALSPDISN